MSLIEEALRRIQDPSLPTQQTAPPKPGGKDQSSTAHSWSSTPPPVSAKVTTTSQRATNVLVAVTVAILALTALLVAGGAVWLFRIDMGEKPEPIVETSRTTSPQASVVAPVIPSVERAEPLPKTASRQPEELSLSGVVEGLGEPYAVINGAIVGVGERVGTFTLTAVHDGAAILRRDDGTDTILRVSR